MKNTFTNIIYSSKKKSFILWCLFLLSTFSLQAQSTFSNSSAIDLPDGATLPIPGSLYPSKIEVAGLQGIVSKLTVTIKGFEHNNPDAVDMLLVAPDGTNAIVLSDIGGADDIFGIDITLDDAALTALPDYLTFGAGKYRPANFGSSLDVWPSPAPNPTKQTPLSSFYGVNPNGTWSLYVVNDTKGNFGAITGGWSLTVSTVLAADAVKIKNFTGTHNKEKNQILIDWSTESEYYIKSFTVEKSVNGSNWNTVNTVSSEGSTPLARNYEYVDNSISYGTSVYRLNVEGKDQSFKYTDAVNVQVVDDRPCSIICPADITVPATPGQCSAIVTFAEPTLSGNCGTVTASQASGSFFPVGTTIVTVTSSFGSSSSFKVIVTDNEKPSLSLPANITTSTDRGVSFATINPGKAIASDNCSGTTVSASRSDGKALNESYPLGTTTITWTATDAAGNSTSSPQTILVNDTEAPMIGYITPTSDSLWPPNHKMYDVNLGYTNTDNVAIVSTKLTVASTEPADATGDGYFGPDYEIVNNNLVRLRAERSGGGSGRSYIITVTSTDAAGNVSNRSTTVTVSSNMSSNADPEKALSVKVLSSSASSYFALQIRGNGSTEKVNLQVTDAITGLLIETRSNLDPNGRVQFGANYRQGIYYVQVTQGQERVVLKLAK